jgi:hypothetical protein
MGGIETDIVRWVCEKVACTNRIKQVSFRQMPRLNKSSVVDNEVEMRGGGKRSCSPEKARVPLGQGNGPGKGYLKGRKLIGLDTNIIHNYKNGNFTTLINQISTTLGAPECAIGIWIHRNHTTPGDPWE